MQVSENGLELIRISEGLVLHAYPDAGGWSIGYGHHHGVKPGDTCTKDQAEEWLHEDAQAVLNAIEQFVHVEINQNQVDALVDFGYNLGTFALQESTLLRKLNLEDFDGAALEFPKWCYVQHQKSQNLLARREREQKLFETPEWHPL